MGKNNASSPGGILYTSRKSWLVMTLVCCYWLAALAVGQSEGGSVLFGTGWEECFSVPRETSSVGRIQSNHT